jgi:hypothetical protein
MILCKNCVYVKNLKCIGNTLEYSCDRNPKNIIIHNGLFFETNNCLNKEENTNENNN